MERLAQAFTPGSTQAVSPLDTLLEAIAQAQHFIHFASYGISEQLVGVLRLVAARIPVCGVVSNTPPAHREELRSAWSRDAAGLRLQCVSPGRQWASAPHERLIVIDGSVALRGSVNLTLGNWRDPHLLARGGVTVETNAAAVRALNNRHLVPLWQRGSWAGAATAARGPHAQP